MTKPARPQPLRAKQDIVKGVLYMVLAAFCFGIMNIFVRLASESVPALEIAFFRNLFALIFILPLVWSGGFSGLRTTKFKLHLVRAIVGAIAMSIWFTALSLVPLADAIALNFTLPLFVVTGAAIFFGEKVGTRRWSATAIGFLGMAVILRPGFNEISAPMALPVLAALFMAVSMLLLKKLTATESPAANVLYMNLMMTPISFVPMLFVWRSFDWVVLIYLAMLGLLAMMAHLSLARAYAYADASAIMPLDYLRLPFIAIAAYFIFGEVADIWTWAGAGIIAGSSLYIGRREAMLAKSQEVKSDVAHIVREP